MEKMSMLQKLFIKYGEDGARNPSPRGCYEPVVPEALKAQVLATQNHTNHKDEQSLIIAVNKYLYNLPYDFAQSRRDLSQ